MLTNKEAYFIKVLRGTVISTASLAFFAAIITLAFAAYAQFSPEAKINLKDRVIDISKSLEPRIMINEIYPEDSWVAKHISTIQSGSYTYTKPSDQDLLNSFNKFLEVAINGKFENLEKFSSWLQGPNAFKLTWKEEINSENANNENNIHNLALSLLGYYADRLQVYAPILKESEVEKHYPTDGILKLTDTTGAERAPYFLFWFFKTLQSQIQSAGEDLEAEKTKRADLKAMAPLLLSISAATFVYFITIMFLFLVISIEASVRRIAEETTAKKANNEKAA